MENVKLVDSYWDFLGQILKNLDEPEGLKEAINKKREELNTFKENMQKDIKEFDNALEILDVQRTQARELIEAEFGEYTENSQEINPVEFLNRYYKTIIDELKGEIEEYQRKQGKNSMNVVKISPKKDEESPSRSPNEIAQNYQTENYILVFYYQFFIIYRKRKMKKLCFNYTN